MQEIAQSDNPSFLGKHKWEILFAFIFFAIGYVFPPEYVRSVISDLLNKIPSFTTLQSESFIKQHGWEIIFAFIFAVFATAALEIVIKTIKRYSTPKSPLLPRDEARMPVAIRPSETQQPPASPSLIKEPLSEKQIEDAVRVNIKKVSKKYIVRAIKENEALYKCLGIHFTSCSRNYHLGRMFYLLPVLKDSSFSLLSESIASGIDFSDVRYVLYNKKIGGQSSDANQLFATRFMERIAVKIEADAEPSIKTQGITYDEEKRTVIPELIDPDALRGKKVIVLESLLIFPDVLTDTIAGIQSLGATIKKVIVLCDGSYDGSNSRINLSPCKIDQRDVTIGSFINLRMSLAYQCECPSDAELQILKYDDY
ncbi:MAG: hypothetical protein WA126_16565 [Thermodesulfovibrionales bacterium]